MRRADNLSTIGDLGYVPAQGSLREKYANEERGRRIVSSGLNLWDIVQFFYFTLNKSVPSWTEKIRTFRSNAFPIPFEHLGDHS